MFRATELREGRTLAHIGGQPLGLAFDRDQNLYVAVAAWALSGRPNGEVTKATR